MKEDKIHAIPQVAKNNSSSNIANNIKKVPPITPKIITIFPNISRVSSTEDDEVESDEKLSLSSDVPPYKKPKILFLSSYYSSESPSILFISSSSTFCMRSG